MIKDWNSSYLQRGFMTLSDECLSEAIKGMRPFKAKMSKGHKTLQQLISEVHWFHEATTKSVAPAMAGINKPFDAAGLITRFKKMEENKVALVDEIDISTAELRRVMTNDQIAIAMGVLGVFLALAGLMVQEDQENRARNQIELRSKGLLSGTKLENSSVIDQLIDEALMNSSMEHTAQLFRDYHGEMLEKQTAKFAESDERVAVLEEAKMTKAIEQFDEEMNNIVDEENISSSFKNVLVTLHNIHGKGTINASEIREVRLAIEDEALEQVMNAAITKLIEHKYGNKRIQISNQVHSDRCIVNFFLKDATFNVNELEFSSGKTTGSDDLNLILLKEICADSKVQWAVENKLSRSGTIEGMNIRLVIPRTTKNNNKNLVSVVRGKKRDIKSGLSNEMMN